VAGAANGAAAPASTSRAVSPGPPGAKRIGTARFVDGATAHSAGAKGRNGSGSATQTGQNGQNGKGQNGANGGGDRLAAPTVTMRPDK
jgi:hypothetical protein